MMMKPVFLSREKRQRLAVVAADDQRRSSALESPSSLPRSTAPPLPTTSKRARESSSYRDDKDDREKDRLETERKNLLEMIREHYVGTSTNKKQARTTVAAMRRPSHELRTSFDWDNTEDTTSRVDDMTNALRHQPPPLLLYGRGFLAGIDRREQKKAARVELRRRHTCSLLEDKTKKNASNTRVQVQVQDRHWTDKAVEEMTDRDWRIFLEDFDISYKGAASRVPANRPMRDWKESKLGTSLLRAIDKAGYRKPSPIQMAAIPLGLQRRDVIGIAGTGSGKTPAFVLPMLSYITTRMPPAPPIINAAAAAAEGPYTLVMAPTRELAQQIEREASRFAACLGIKVVSIVGGQYIEEQAFKVAQGCEVVIATPGRLLDCLERRYIVLNRCNYVVLDEADRMIDMGFEPQVVAVLDAMPTNVEDDELNIEKKKDIYRTTHMFSATMAPAVERLARKYLRNPVVVTVGGTSGNNKQAAITGLITQNVIMVKKESDKMPRLHKILSDDLGAGDVDKSSSTAAVSVFCNTRKSADTRARDLEKLGFRVATLHGGMSQEQRELSLAGFRSRSRRRRFNVLVATDVAGRGIDVPDVAHVVNYEMPGSIDTYVHRIGRTGRAGKKGIATSFLTLEEDAGIFFDLKEVLVRSGSSVPPELARHEASRFKPGPDNIPLKRGRTM